MSIATGTKLGQYEVQDFIGQGAMGVVYRAYHAQLERTGAIKVMQAITPDADTVARFRHEAQAIAKMRHPNIVDVYDFGEYEGMPYMIVEYVPGGSLSNRMAHGRLDQATALRYLRGIAAGLDYAHTHGVVHRDVKPANVLLTADDMPVLADFGLAKLMQGSSLKSMTGVTTGTPAYMAPEQVTGSKVGPASDRYSLATIAYEMLTGVIPFDGEALMELLYAQVHREPVPPSSRYPDLGPQVDAVIMRGLAKDPAARWESCTAFVDALTAALAATPAEKTVVMSPRFASTLPLVPAAVAERVAKPSKRASPRPPATVAMAYPAPAPTAPMPAPAKPKRRWLRRVAIGVVALVLLVVLFGVCQALAATTLALNPTTAAPGQSVRLTATHVPAYQAGTILLRSVLHIYPFRADSSGQVSTSIAVPRDIALGDHTVSICWNSACHASIALHVVSSTGLVLASPIGPSTGVTPSPSPTSTPRPTSTPTTTGPPKTPPPAPTPVITISNYYVKLATGSETVSGFHFAPGSTITISFVQGAAVNQVMGSTAASSSGSFYFTFSMSRVVGALPGPAHIKACGSSNGCYDATVQVTT